MNVQPADLWLDSVRQTITSYRQMIDATVAQLTDEELRARPGQTFNSVAVLLRHLGGNLQSRWTDFLTSDGEKPDRNRDAELTDWAGDRQSLLEYFDAGWLALTRAIDSVNEQNIHRSIMIRGEPHSIPYAVARSVTHIAYHVGQMVMIARMVHVGEWRWLTIAPNASSKFNEQTWGTPASRSILASPKDSGPKAM